MDVSIPAQDVDVTSGYEVVYTTQSVSSNYTPFTITVDAPAGTKVVGGGYYSNVNLANFTQNGPAADGSSWTVAAGGANAGSVTVYAIVMELP